MSRGLAAKPTFVANDHGRFLIMDAPTDQNLPTYLEECKKHNVRVIVRACEPTYGTAPLEKAGIRVVELPFPDGEAPPHHVVSAWLDICKHEFDEADQRTVAVHCVAGLGRAPVLVATYLVNSGMEPLDAIEFIRKKRRGAINAKQLKFLESYKRTSSGCCVIS